MRARRMSRCLLLISSESVFFSLKEILTATFVGIFSQVLSVSVSDLTGASDMVVSSVEVSLVFVIVGRFFVAAT